MRKSIRRICRLENHVADESSTRSSIAIRVIDLEEQFVAQLQILPGSSTCLIVAERPVQAVELRQRLHRKLYTFYTCTQTCVCNSKEAQMMLYAPRTMEFMSLDVHFVRESSRNSDFHVAWHWMARLSHQFLKSSVALVQTDCSINNLLKVARLIQSIFFNITYIQEML